MHKRLQSANNYVKNCIAILTSSLNSRSSILFPFFTKYYMFTPIGESSRQVMKRGFSTNENKIPSSLQAALA